MTDSERFGTFANSPKSMPKGDFPRSTDDYANQRSPLSIQTIRDQMQQAFKSNSLNSRSKLKSTRFKYPTEVSLMDSGISLVSAVVADLPLQLLSFEVELTEEILALREDKLTLMEEYNKILDSKFSAQRELAKLKKLKEEKSRESSEVGGELWLNDLQQSTQLPSRAETNPIIVKNQELKAEYKQVLKRKKSSLDLASRDEEDNAIEQIQQLQEMSASIEEKLKKIEEKTEQINQQRFETFFPNQTKTKNPMNLAQELNKLRNERAVLQKQLANQIPNSQFAFALNELINQNRQLQKEADALLSGKNQGSIHLLQAKIQEEESAKEGFLDDLMKFKEEVGRIRRQNQELRRKAIWS